MNLITLKKCRSYLNPCKSRIIYCYLTKKLNCLSKQLFIGKSFIILHTQSTVRYKTYEVGM